MTVNTRRKILLSIDLISDYSLGIIAHKLLGSLSSGAYLAGVHYQFLDYIIVLVAAIYGLGEDLSLSDVRLHLVQLTQ